MRVDALSCNKCGAPLQVSETTNYVTCSHCGSRLVVRRNEAAVYTEILSEIKQDTGAILNHTNTLLEQNRQMASQLTRMRLQGELEKLDQEWASTEKAYFASFHEGTKRIPSKQQAKGRVTLSVVVSLLGAFFTLVGVINMLMPRPSGVSLVLGVLILIYGFASYRRAKWDLNYAIAYENVWIMHMKNREAIMYQLRQLDAPPAQLQSQPY
jgi:DNA-directed RNA polymerase subunit RPC12/RpoP